MKPLRNTHAGSERDEKAAPCGVLKLAVVSALLFVTVIAVPVAGLAFHGLHRCGGRRKSSLTRLLRLLLIGPLLLLLAIVALCVAGPSWLALRFISSKAPRLCSNCRETEAAADSNLCRACVEVGAIETGRGPAVLDHLESDMQRTTEKWLPPGWLSVPLENGQSVIVARNGDEESPS